MFKKLLSYFWPLTRRISSDYSGQLEITWYNGQKLLDSQHTNYSYGNLQKVLAFGLSQLSFSSQDKVLVLGLGGGSVIQTLRQQFKHTGSITAVEIDPVIVQIALEEFKLSEDNKLNIHTVDAFDFVKQISSVFDLIIVDLFIDTQVPDQFYATDFWNTLIQQLSERGKILFNAGITASSRIKLEELQNNLTQSVQFDSLQLPKTSNTLTVISHLN